MKAIIFSIVAVLLLTQTSIAKELNKKSKKNTTIQKRTIASGELLSPAEEERYWGKIIELAGRVGFEIDEPNNQSAIVRIVDRALGLRPEPATYKATRTFCIGERFAVEDNFRWGIALHDSSRVTLRTYKKVEANAVLIERFYTHVGHNNLIRRERLSRNEDQLLSVEVVDDGQDRFFCEFDHERNNLFKK